MSASERMKNLQEGFHERLTGGMIGREPYTLFAALPELIAVVVAAEEERLLANQGYSAVQLADFLEPALAALDTKLAKK